MLRNQKSFRFSRVKGFAIFATLLALLTAITTLGAGGSRLAFIDSATEFFGLQTSFAPFFSNEQTNAPINVSKKDESASSQVFAVTASLPNLTETPGNITIPLTVGDMTGEGIFSFDIQITFDSAVIQPTGSGIDTAGTLSSGASVTSGVTNAGHLIISGFQATEFSGAGTLVNLKFTVQNNLGASTNLTFEDYTDPGSVFHPGFKFNEGTPVATTTNGSVAIPAATATSTATATDTPTATATETFTPTATATETFTPTATATETFTPTPTATETFTPTATATETFTPTNTNTATATSTATFTPTPQSICANGGNVEISFTPYATLTAAFAAINAGTHTGAIQVYVCANTNEGTGTALLNASGVGGASYASIAVNPFGGAARTISGGTTAGNPMVDFSGADNVTIDGLNTGGNSLTIANTTVSATSGTATVRFIGGATGNTITNSNIQGSGTMAVATNGATIFFSTDAVTANGNDNNTISNNNIGPAGANLPTKAILGNGSTTTTAIGNSGNIINNNNIFDYFGAAVTSSGVAVNGGCNMWSITNNRFYQTGTRTWTTGAVHRAIDLNSSTATSGVQGMTVTGNIIGYASNTQTGTYTMTGSTGKFQGIAFNGISLGTVSNLNTNTIASVSVTGVTSSGTGSTASPFSAILVNNGLAITSSNTIGSQSATGSLTFSTTTTTTSDFYGIYNFSFDNWTASNNNIGGMSITNLGASGTMILYGLRANTGTALTFGASSNNVGGTVANSMSLTSTGAASQVIGMLTGNAIATWTSNNVRNLTNNNGTGTTTSASVIGMSLTSTTPNQTVSQNTIHTLTNTNATLASVVTGIQFTGGTANVVERNLIYNLLASTTSASAEINGIRVAGGTTQYRNNMIALGANQANAIGAVASNSSTTGINGFNGFLGTDTFVHNSVYIGGTATSGSGASYALNGTQTTNTRSFRDNIFQNARTNSGATGKHYAVKINGTTANPTGLTINNNLYFANGASGAVFGFFNSLDVANLTAWKAAVGQDVASFESNPQYNDPTNAVPDLHLHPTNPTVAEGNGFDVGVILDYDGQTRSGLTPVDIGADAGNFSGLDLAAPAITYTALGNTTSTANRILSVTITDTTGVDTGGNAPRIYFNKNAGAYFSTACSLASGTVNNGVWDCTIDNTLIGGVVVTDVVRYHVVAQDTLGNLASNPSAGFTGTNVNTVTTPPTTPNSYIIVNAPLNGDYTVGISSFSRITGKTVTFEARTRTIYQDVPAETLENRSPGANNAATADDAETKSAAEIKTGLEMASEATVRRVAVEETYYVPMVDGVEQTKPLYHEFTPKEREENGFAPEMVGIYARVRDAVDDYNLRGVSGHTRFLLLDSLYDSVSGETFPFVVSTSNAAEPSSTATLTFQPNTGVTSTISGSSTSGIFVLADQYVKIDGDNVGGSVSRDLTVQNTGTGASSYVIGFFNLGGTKAARNGTVRYTNVQGGVTAVATTSWGIIFNGAGGDYDNALIEYNKIYQAFIGIGNYGVAVTGINNNGVISNNIIGDTASSNSSIKSRGIEITQSDNLTVSGNDIFGFPAGNSNSVQIGVLEATGSSNITIARNQIHDFYYTGTGGLGNFGIATAANAGTTNIINNMIHNIKGDGDVFNTATSITWMPAGISITGANSGTLNIDNNSIYMNGATLGSSFSGNSACISSIAGITGVNLRNNALRNSMTTVGAPVAGNRTYAFAAIGATSSGAMFNVVNKNDYFVDGTNPRIGTLAQTDRTLLTDWQTATGQDAGSITVDPLFVSVTDQHISPVSPLLNVGLTLANVPNDFDGDIRPTSTGYEIGADERGDPTPTATNTATATATNTDTPTPTATETFTPTATSTETFTPTNTATDTPTNTPTETATNTATPTPTAATCPKTVLPNDGGTSGNARAPSTRFAGSRSHYLITAAELAAAGYLPGSVPSTIGWNYQTGPGVSGSAPLTVYMENTADTANIKSATWATAISTMSVVHNAATTLPAGAGTFDITMSGGSPFTYTGGGLYIAFDWGPYAGANGASVIFCNAGGLVNGLKGANSQGATVAASSFRPETRLNGSPSVNDAAVTAVYSYGELPLGLAPAQSIQAVVTNNSASVMTNVPVTLNITGVNTFTDVQTIPSLAACGGQAVVTFAVFTPGAIGSDTVTVSVPADAVNTNNSQSKALNITAADYSYKHPGSTASGGVGLAGSTGAFVSKFTTSASQTVTDVKLEFFAASATTYRVAIYGDASGVPSTTPLYVDAANRTVTVAGPVTITLPLPVAVGPGAFYVGIQQTNTTNASLSFDSENPVRNGSFFLAIPNPPASWINFAPGNNFKLNIGLILGAAPTPTNTATPTATATETFTPTPTATNTDTPTPTATATETFTPTPTATETSTPTATATDTPTATNTATATPTAEGVINGTITYGNANGLPAPPRFISNVQVNGAGSPPVSAITDGIGPTAGQYSLTGFGTGSYTVTPSKTGGVNSAINSFDAGRIAQHVTAINLLTGNARVAADTSGNGSINSFDAAQIAAYVVALPPYGNAGQWRFYTLPTIPFPVGSTPTSRTYPSVSGTTNGEDYTGILVGEVSGNWVNTGARPASGPERQAAAALPSLVAPADGEVLIPVSVQGAANKGIIAYEFDLRYDPSVIQPQADPINVAGTVSRGLSVVANAAEPGLLRVAVYGAMPIDENGLLMNLRFTAVGAPGTVSPLTWEKLIFNEGDPQTLVTDGQIELSAAAPNQAEMTGRVVNAMGQGVANARVILTDITGASRSMVSDGSGVYRFGGLQVGQTFTISVDARQSKFAPLTVSVTGQSVNVDMIAGQ